MKFLILVLAICSIFAFADEPGSGGPQRVKCNTIADGMVKSVTQQKGQRVMAFSLSKAAIPKDFGIAFQKPEVNLEFAQENAVDLDGPGLLYTTKTLRIPGDKAVNFAVMVEDSEALKNNGEVKIIGLSATIKTLNSTDFVVKKCYFPELSQAIAAPATVKKVKTEKKSVK
jgi:hypothetical protein